MQPAASLPRPSAPARNGHAAKSAPAPLPVHRLRWHCDPAALGFATTAEVPPIEHTVGQERGVRALDLALHLDARGYNVYVAGPSGTGRTTSVRRLVKGAAAEGHTSSDWCYIHNFADPSQPIAVELPVGRAPRFAEDMDQLISACRREIPKVFEDEQYQEQRNAIMRDLQGRRDTIFGGLKEAAAELGFDVQATPTGLATIPLIAPGKPITQDTFEVLPDEKKAEIRERSQQVDRKIEDVVRSVHKLEREAHDRMHTLDRETVGYAVGHLLEALRTEYADHPTVVQALNAIQSDLVEHLDEYRGEHEPSGPFAQAQSPSYERYRVHVLVTHKAGNGAPVVFEPNPTYYNLLGRIDFRASIGAMYTDYTLIKPGALHRANGGFLVLQARDLLLSPFAWDALKRAIRDGEVRVENLGEQYSAFPTATIKPKPIPLHVKVILIGDLITYMLLYRLDEDFRKLFKVKAHFSPVMDRSDESVQTYAAFVSSQVQDRGLLPFASDAVAQVVEQGARLAEHQERLATRFDAVSELVVEADYWARKAGASVVVAEHVERALGEQEHRANLIEEETQRLIDEGTVAIDTRADVVGQVNGLSVLDFGDYRFARPSRITVRTGMGSEGVVDVEREVEMSGPTHSKGVLILNGYLVGQYAQEKPLSLSARLAFEQVYSEVDGDSASSAELYALLSSLSGLPIHQGIAVTGSINQAGQVQAIGEVTAKIEGFFAVCKSQGLTGKQGVVIPATNARHLMLKQEVLDAVAAGQFHVWAVETVDEGIELLTGVPAGTRKADGTFPAGTVHDRVQERLSALANRLKEFGEHRGRGRGKAVVGAGSNRMKG